MLRLIRRLATLAALVVATATAGFVGFIVLSRDVAPSDRTADGIAALTGGAKRLDTAYALLEAQRGRRLLVSGVNPATTPEDLRDLLGADVAVYDAKVDVGRGAVDTEGNARETAEWARTNGFGSILLVTADYHMLRSVMEMRRVAPEIAVAAYPVATGALDPAAWPGDPALFRIAVREYGKTAAAWMRGLLRPAEATP